MAQIKIFVSGMLPNDEQVAVIEDITLLRTLSDAVKSINDAFPFLTKVPMVFYYKGKYTANIVGKRAECLV